MDAIGKYRIVKRLAIGGMGEIFLAREHGVAGLERLVVVKRMLPEMSERADSVALFVDEARIVAHLTHPNIVQIYELGQDGDAYFIAMEYVPGQNLARICERATKASNRPLTTRLAAHIVAELAHGLHFAHEATDLDGKPLSIVHRDVSPHNCLLSVHGDVKVMDFGIAKAANTTHRTQTGVIRGKYAYMSPEQLAGQRVDAATDVYAAGVVLWELSLVRRMFKAKDELELIDLVRAGTFARPRDIDADYPRELEDIVMAALARDPSRRTPSAGELARQLRLFLSTTGAPVQRPELGELVRTLFPDVDHLAPARALPTLDTATRSMPGPELTASTTPQAPELQLVTAPSIAAAEVTAAPTSKSSIRSRVLGLGAVCVLAIGAAVVIKVRVASEDESSSSSPSAASTASRSDVTTTTRDAPAVIATIDGIGSGAAATGDAGGSSDSTTVASGDDAGVGRVDATASKVPAKAANAGTKTDTKAGTNNDAKTTAKNGTNNGTKTTAKTKPPVTTTLDAPDAGIAVAPTGTLIVDADPWGTISGAGIAAGAITPRRIELADGAHDIAVTLSEGGVTVRTRARVIAGKRTKCLATAKGLACAQPE
ncbi:MAG: protein kinase domain-containing protein [Kofleriaceae bacterium]